MEETKRLYRESLPARIEGLNLLRKAVQENQPEAVSAFKRIAHTLRVSGAGNGFPEITFAAAVAEDAEKQDTLAELDALVNTLGEVVSSGGVKKPGILLLDPDEKSSKQVQQKLASETREIFVARTLAGAEECLARHDIVLIVLELDLPDGDGRYLLTRLRERGEAAIPIPVIVLTSKGQDQARTACLAFGADAYLAKPADLDVLAALVGARIKRSAQLTRTLQRDPLTGLHNRAAFTEAFGRAEAYFAAIQEPFSVAILDMDNLKRINEQYGFAAGDDVLRRFAGMLTGTLRRTDYSARWGGEEFAVFFPYTSAAVAGKVLEKALNTLRATSFLASQDWTFSMTFSAGVVDVPKGLNAEKATAKASRLCFQAKESGRNCIITPENKPDAVKKRILLAEDSDVIASVIKSRLEAEGFEVLHFPDGQAAWNAVEAGTVADLCILDIEMPRMTGLKLLQKLRKHPVFVKTPVSMLTSLGSEKDVVKGFELGADDYLTKPVSVVDFVTRVHRLLMRS